MIRFVRTLALVGCVVAGSINAQAQQDSTVEWRLSLQDLERRLATVSDADRPAVDAWRRDAEALRSSLTFFVAAHADIHVKLPPTLPGDPSVSLLEPQLEQ
ncbi:MAG TPA: hypothetical protein VNZ26_18185, partial [Vicinamibacterales bacterium]|nr:hypothetical protein [Vicinamibacterales bacterium]